MKTARRKLREFFAGAGRIRPRSVEGSHFVQEDSGPAIGARDCRLDERQRALSEDGRRDCRSDSRCLIKAPVTLPARVVNPSLENCTASSASRRTAMFSSREAYDNDFCPVRDELLGEMYRASESGLPKLVESVSAEVRAGLALFCYRKSHLYSLALAIAASCSERDLIQLGGRVGSTLYALSRQAPSARVAASSGYNGRKPITLSTKPLSTFKPIEDELDDDDLAEAVTA
jgi:hypothetical protein